MTPKRPRFSTCIRAIAACLAATVAVGSTNSASAVEQKYWGVTPYQVRIELAVDSRTRPAPQLAEQLAADLLDRIDAAIGPLWTTDLTIATGARRAALLDDLAATPWEELSPEVRSSDKLILLAVQATPAGWQLRSREFDAYLRRWNDPAAITVAQRSRLNEACFQALVDSFSPLAVVRTLEDNDEQVELLPRGHELPLPTGAMPFFTAGMALEPVLRRTDRSGELLENGVIPIPWTYLTAAVPQDDRWIADVHAGVRRPFRARRRGQVEQLAVGLSPRGGSTTVRFYARHDKEIGLAGYEVFEKSGDDDAQLTGVTNREGEVDIPRGERAVVMLFLRSDGQLLAKIPVAPGAVPRLEAPIADDAARLQAQAELRTVREELIDLVARRAILIGRVKSYLGADRLDDAQKLMIELGNLPGVSHFSREIDQAENSARSTDEAIQTRIEAMFADTRKLLATFLNRKPITDLQAEVNQARRAAN